MGIFFLIISFFLLLGFVFLFYFLHQKFREIKEEQKENQSFLMLQNQLTELSKIVDGKLSESHKTTTEIIKELTKIDAASKQMIDVAKRIEGLENILKNPKQRGVLGEYYLETVLKNLLPPNNYQIQYKFKDGQMVDAIIFFGKKILPIDSKFSLENYNRIAQEKNPQEREKLEKLFKQDLKNRIDETAKYIRPEEGTLNLAFMFIPSEGIYYDLLVNEIGTIKISTRDLIQYAHEKNVHIVSPTTFAVYLQLLAESLRAYQISESTKEIIKRIEDLRRHLSQYDFFLQKLGKNLSLTVNTYNQSYREFKKIDKDVSKITNKKEMVKPLEIEKPREET